MRYNSLAVIFTISTLLFSIVTVEAQIKDVELNLGVYSSFSSKEYQPFWISTNQYGIYDTYSRSNNILNVSARHNVYSNSSIDITYGINVIGRISNNESELFLKEGYLTAESGIFQLDIGRKTNNWGENSESLSSGSMALSKNSTPIPIINISIPDFSTVPFTHNLFQFKGNLTHGWFEDSRYVKSAYLHQKSFYLQAGLEQWPVRIYGGMVHIAQWGGKSPSFGDLGGGLEDLKKVFFGREGNEGTANIEQANALGNHLGIWDFGLNGKIKPIEINFYWQHFFDDNSGLRFRNFGDGLFGLNIKKERTGIVSELTWEFIHTKYQSGRGLPDRPADIPFCQEENCGYEYGGRDNYYNNSVYRSGWTYHGAIIGNPLLLTRQQGNVYFGAEHSFSESIISNRLLGHHLGFTGELSKQVNYTAFFTFVRHYGTYGGVGFGKLDTGNDLESYLFYPSLQQWYLMFETEYQFKVYNQLKFITKLGLDMGKMSNNIGLMVGVKWKNKIR